MNERGFASVYRDAKGKDRTEYHLPKDMMLTWPPPVRTSLSWKHPNVCRDIRNMLDKLGEGPSRFAHTYFDVQGKGQEEYHLPKDLTFTLVSGYSVPLRHKIVTRWQSLEQAERAPVVPQSLPEALRLAADLAEKNAALAIENQKLAPLAKVGDVAVSHKRGVVEIGRKLPGVYTL